MIVRPAKYENDYRLLVEFQDGKMIEADFRDFIVNSLQPMTYQFKDQKLFAQVKVTNGYLNWFDEMDFNPVSLYYNQIPGVVIHDIHPAKFLG